MSPRPAPAAGPDRRGALLAGLVGLGLAVLLALAGAVAPGLVLRGWLIAFASVAGVALGCTAWLAIHGLTGGRWGEAGRPVLLAGAAALPLVLLLGLPLILLDHWLYPWAVRPDTAGPDVARLYLNTPFLALRSLVLIGGLSWVGWRARAGALPPLLAGLALLLYGGLMNLAAYDWLLSLDPRYGSSAIGMQVIAAQLLSALCVVVLASDAPEGDPVWGDWGGLLLACLLGVAYLVLMTFVVQWYGDQPGDAAWYDGRSTGGWVALEIAAAVCLLGPGVALLFARLRGARAPLRVLAFAILAGVIAVNAWLVAPGGTEGGWALFAGLFALGACGGLAVAVGARASSAWSREGAANV